VADILFVASDAVLFGQIRQLRAEGHRLRVARSGLSAIDRLGAHPDIVFVVHPVRDRDGFDLLQRAREGGYWGLFLIATSRSVSIADMTLAIRFRLDEIIELPRHASNLSYFIRRAVEQSSYEGESSGRARIVSCHEAHAAARVVRALLAVVQTQDDPRTLAGWSRCSFASVGTIRNWCYTAGIPPRRCLVFGRLLRVVLRSNRERCRPENLLAVVDRRTLIRLFACAGFTADGFPNTVEEFLQRQTLIADEDFLRETRRAINDLQYRYSHTRRELPCDGALAAS